MDGFAALYLRGFGFIIGGAIFWLIYFDLKDQLKPEPRRLLGLAFLLGCLAAALASWGYRLAEVAGLPVHPGPGAGAVLIFSLLLVGPIEEGGKFLVARAFVFRWHDFDEPIDGLVYAGAIAIGFASVENLLYIPYLDWPHQLARSLASPLTHSLFAALWGFGVSRAFFRARTAVSRFLWQALPLLASMILHGLYDFFILAYGAAYVAALIALVLWIFLIHHARRVVGGSVDPGRVASL